MPLNENQKAFISMFAKTGNLMLSCQQARITRQTVWYWTKTEKDFEAAYTEAKQDFINHLEAIALSKVKTSDTMLIFLLKANLPEKYGDHATIRHELGNTFMDFVRRCEGIADKSQGSEVLAESSRVLLQGSIGNESLGEAIPDNALPGESSQDGGPQLHDGGQDRDSV